MPPRSFTISYSRLDPLHSTRRSNRQQRPVPGAAVYLEAAPLIGTCPAYVDLVTRPPENALDAHLISAFR
jgi:hypothetical protein